ncbi:MAG: hypothetical protein IJH92_01825 [Mogibacterium sp.]|nr:hypothetical protein [Mogibacterium sp.]
MRRSAEAVYVNTMPASAAVRRRERKAARLRADKRNAIKMIALLMLGIFVLVGMRSYAAILQHENNTLIEQNEFIQAEIDSLNSQIVEATKITELERKATEEYGMVYPTPDNCIRLGEEKSDDAQELASSIRSEAYN